MRARTLTVRTRAANMAAAAQAALWLLPFALCQLSGQTGIDRRFAQLKRCADEECSMLMCRGKAVEDFLGSDCRFLDFKRGDTVYVYYKLEGGITELWAGSVNNKFGYFPKDLLEVDQVYSEEELELPTDATDFVCFEGGKDDFDNYNVEELLKKPEETDLQKEAHSNVQPTREPKEESEKENEHKFPEEKPQKEDTNESSENAEDGNTDNILVEFEEVVIIEGTDDTIDPFVSKKMEHVEETLQPARDDDFTINHELENSQGDIVASQHFKEILENKLQIPGDSSHTKYFTISQGDDDIRTDKKNEEIEAYTQLSKETLATLKTHLGSTADAIVTDDETTGRITSTNKYAEDSTLEHQDPQMEEEVKENSEETPLLSYEAVEFKSVMESKDVEEPAAFLKADVRNSPDEEKQNKEAVESFKHEKNGKDLKTTWGDTILAVVGGSEHTSQVTNMEGSNADEQEEKEEEDTKPIVNTKDDIFLLGMDKIKAQQEGNTADELLEEYIKENFNALKDPWHNLRTAQMPDIEQNKEHFTDRKKTSTEELQKTLSNDLNALNVPGINFEVEESSETKEETLTPSLGNSEGTAIHRTAEQIQFDEMGERLQDNLENDASIKMFNKMKDKQNGQLSQEVQNASKMKWKRANLSKSRKEHIILDEEKEMAEGEDSRHPNVSVVEQSEKQERDEMTTASVAKDTSEKQDTQAAAELFKQQAEETKNIEKATDEEQPSDEEETEEQKASNQDLIDNEKHSAKETTSVEREMSIQPEATAYDDHGQHDMDQISNTELKEATDAESELEEEEASKLLEELLEDENAAHAELSREALTKDKNNNNLDIDDTAPNLELTEEPAKMVDKIKASEEAYSTFQQNKRESNVNGRDETERARNKLAFPGTDKETLTNDTSSLENVRENIESGEASTHLESKPDYNITEESEEAPKDLTEKADTGSKQSENAIELSDELLPEGNINETTLEPEYNELVKNLTIIRKYLKEQHIERLLRYLGLHNIFRVEAMFHDMESELKLAQKDNREHEDIEKALDQILESSESSILDEVEKILDTAEEEERMPKGKDLFNEEYIILDDLQEIAYQLRHKHSVVDDSTPLAPGVHVPTESGKDVELNKESLRSDAARKVEPEFLDHGGDGPFLDDQEKRMQTAKEAWQDASVLEEIESLYKKDDVPSSGSINSVQNSMEEFDAGAMTENTVEVERDEHESGSSILTSEGSITQVAKLVASLPEDIRPGSDFYGLPWKPIIITALVGAATLAIFLWRTCLSVKSRVYQANEKQLAERIKNLIQEKSEVLEKISDYERKMKESKEFVKDAHKENTALSAEAKGLKESIKVLEEKNRQLTASMKNQQAVLRTEREQSTKKQDTILETQKSVEKLQEVIAQHSAELSEVQIALSEAKLSEQKLKSDVRNVQEENARLKKSKEQLLKEAEGWSERHTEMSEQIRLYQMSQKDMEEALAYKENEIEVLTNCLMQLKQLENDFESERRADEGDDWDKAGGDLSNGELSDEHRQKMKSQIRQLMDVSRVKTMLAIIEEDRDLLQTKLSDEISARHELEEQIEKLEHDRSSVHTSKTRLENECKTLQQKVEILTELYQQKEMALQKKLTQEEYERLEKEQKLTAADEKALLASQEVKVYKQRIQEMEEELEKTEKSYKNQIASHEKKAHDNWLIARSAERTLAEEKRESANLRQKLIEVNQKIAMLQRPFIVKPTPGRPDHQTQGRRGPLSRDGSFGPSPVSGGAPSPPLMMEPPGRPASANLNRREVPRGEFDGPSAARRQPLEVSGRVSAPDLGRSVAAMLNSGPRTSSPSTMMDGLQSPSKEPEPPSIVAVPPTSDEPDAVMAGSRGPPSFPGTPLMNSSLTGPPPQPPIRFGPPLPRGSYGPRPLPSLIRGPPLPPGARDYLPGPPPGIRELPPGPLPLMRELLPGPLPGMRGLPPGPPPEMRGLPPLPPPEMRGLPPGPPLEMRGLPPGPPPEMRGLPPGPPPEMRGLPPGPPPEMRGLPPGPPPEMRGHPPGPLGPPTDPREYVRALTHYGPVGLREHLSGPPAQRDVLLPARDFFPPGTRDHPPAPPPASSQINCTEVPEHRQ